MADTAHDDVVYDDAALPRGYFYLPPGYTNPSDLAKIYQEESADPHDRYEFKLSAICATRRTAFQTVSIVDTISYGRALFLDGAIQSSAYDESLYHETLVQPALLMHDNPRDVLIIGGGEGATLREVIAHYTVSSATMVDIDREAVELCREHLHRWHRGAFEDPRVRLVFEDGRKFLEEDDRLYDVIVLDVVDMLDNGPAQALYTYEFYAMTKRHLRPGGILAIQAMEFSHLDYQHHAAIARTLRLVFSEVHSYRTNIPSFLSSWGFILASDDVAPRQWSPMALDRRIEERLGREWLDHLTGEFILSTFTLCAETQRMIGLPGPVLRDGLHFINPPGVDEIDPLHAEFPARQP